MLKKRRAKSGQFFAFTNPLLRHAIITTTSRKSNMISYHKGSHTRSFRSWTVLTILTIIFLVMAIVADPQTIEAQEIKTDKGFEVLLNEKSIHLLSQRLKADLENPRAVFAEILKQLPPTVKVYPTENYYYFHFFHNGQRYAGNIRLGQPDIRAGKVMFNYFLATTSWHFDEKDHFIIFGQKDDVKIVSHSPLEHTITVDDVSVRFELNDLSKIIPPEGLLGPQEIYLGPVFDESGMEFYLVYNRARRHFAFYLNEFSASRDSFIALSKKSPFEQGLRTGFVFWHNKSRNRRLLIAVYEQNVELNNTLDGPFDQLPDNFIKGDELKDAILHARPDMKEKIDRYGNFAGEKQRFLVSPYLTYFVPEDLDTLELCTKNIKPQKVEDCIISKVPPP